MKTEDICERKHGGAETSEAAFKKIEPKIRGVHNEILGLMKHLTHGLTSKEYAEITGKGLNTISGRFSELQKAGKIERVSMRRGGCAVWRVAK